MKCHFCDKELIKTEEDDSGYRFISYSCPQKSDEPPIIHDEYSHFYIEEFYSSSHFESITYYRSLPYVVNLYPLQNHTSIYKFNGSFHDPLADFDYLIDIPKDINKFVKRIDTLLIFS